MKKSIVIAIDGPAASGKSSVAEGVAREFGFLMVNSGIMYRAFAWEVLRLGIDPCDRAAVSAALAETQFACQLRAGISHIEVNGIDPGDELRSGPVNVLVSQVAAIPEVRTRMVIEQRRYAELGSLVMEGRDIGTVVFPQAALKIYLDATPEIRTQRRRKEGSSDDIRKRDQVDSTRTTAPLRLAHDARIVDTSYLSLPEVIEKVCWLAHEAGIQPETPAAASKQKGWVYLAGYAASKAFLRTLYRTEVYGAEHANFEGGALIASNHESFLDPPLVGSCLDEAIYYMARQSLFRPGLMTWLLPRVNAIPVERDRADLASLRTFMRLVQQGKKLLIFPEGTRTEDGELQAAQRGVGVIIAKSKAPVIPVRIFGSFQIFPRNAKFPRLYGKLKVVFGKRIDFDPRHLEGKDGSQFAADRVMAAIAALRPPGE